GPWPDSATSPSTLVTSTIATTYPAMRTPLSWSPERRRLDHHRDADRDREEHRDGRRDDDRALAPRWPAAARRSPSGVVVPRHEREPADADVRGRQDGNPQADPEDPRAEPFRPREPRGMLIDECDDAADDRQGHEPGPHGLAVGAQPG